jgi:hypothetical protein
VSLMGENADISFVRLVRRDDCFNFFCTGFERMIE